MIRSAIAACALAASGAAHATPETRPNDPPAATAAMPADDGKAAAARPKQYCIKSAMTGTRIDRMICKTRKQWLNEGFDPLKPE